jgi:hypothetical protein
MEESLLRSPVVCPECGKESLTEFPIASIAEALATGSSIRLYVQCHDKAWHANSLEREQLREYLEAANLGRLGPERKSAVPLTTGLYPPAG